MKALESDVKAGRLKKQMGKCILEDRPKDKDFSYRLTGKDSKLVLHGFMFLVDAIKGDSENPELITKLICTVFIAIKLRDCISRFSMYHITPTVVQELQQMSHVTSQQLSFSLTKFHALESGVLVNLFQFILSGCLINMELALV